MLGFPSKLRWAELDSSCSKEAVKEQKAALLSCLTPSPLLVMERSERQECKRGDGRNSREIEPIIKTVVGCREEIQQKATTSLTVLTLPQVSLTCLRDGAGS